MKEIGIGSFYFDLLDKYGRYPISGQIELTYRCNLNCVHCYCKTSGDVSRELTTDQWKNILTGIRKEGCIWLSFTGGEPLLRQDFTELYSYAKKEGFIITLLTNGQLVTREICDFLTAAPPFSVEITVNSVEEETYSGITGVHGKLEVLKANVERLVRAGLNVKIKTNLLKENMMQLKEIKEWADSLDTISDTGNVIFQYDELIYPSLKGEKFPLEHRISPSELIKAKQQDPEVWKEYNAGLCREISIVPEDNNILYRCTSWEKQFFIDPYGRLKFCMFSDKFSTDLTKESFHKGFYERFALVKEQKFKTDSKCRNCEFLDICYNCPARAYMETGDEEQPVEYYCALAKDLYEKIQQERGSIS